VDGLTVGAGPAQRHPLRTAAAIAAGVLVIAAVAAVCLFVWLGTYAPLEGLDSGFAPGPGIGAAVQPVTGSLGRPVYFPTLRRGRSFDTAVTLHNKGRFTVTVSGLDEPPPGATRSSSSGSACAATGRRRRRRTSTPTGCGCGTATCRCSRGRRRFVCRSR
jgi:hypothetical protein